MSYMLSMQGQDPLAPLKHVASGIGRDAGQAGDAVSRAASEASGYFAGEASAQRIYRWVDADGITHFGTEKPLDSVAFSTVNVDPNANVMQAYRTPAKSRDQLPETTSEVRAAAPGVPGMTANPLEVRQMLEQVNVTAEQRLQQLENIR